MPIKKIIDGKEYILQPTEEISKRNRENAKRRWAKPGAKEKLNPFWEKHPHYLKSKKLLNPVEVDSQA